MTVDEILERLKALGDAGRHKHNAKTGAPDNQFGVKLGDVREVAKKIKRAVTDSEPEVRYDPVAKPGVSNLLSILGAATGRDPVEAAKGYEQYGPLKSDTAEAVVEMLRPIQARVEELRKDPAQTAALLERGASKAREVASEVVARAKERIGLLPPA